jgi:hypothetical protein
MAAEAVKVIPPLAFNVPDVIVSVARLFVLVLEPAKVISPPTVADPASILHLFSKLVPCVIVTEPLTVKAIPVLWYNRPLVVPLPIVRFAQFAATSTVTLLPPLAITTSFAGPGTTPPTQVPVALQGPPAALLVIVWENNAVPADKVTKMTNRSIDFAF